MFGDCVSYSNSVPNCISINKNYFKYVLLLCYLMTPAANNDLHHAWLRFKSIWKLFFLSALLFSLKTCELLVRKKKEKLLQRVCVCAHK